VLYFETDATASQSSHTPYTKTVPAISTYADIETQDSLKRGLASVVQCRTNDDHFSNVYLLRESKLYASGNNKYGQVSYLCHFFPLKMKTNIEHVCSSTGTIYVVAVELHPTERLGRMYLASQARLPTGDILTLFCYEDFFGVIFAIDGETVQMQLVNWRLGHSATISTDIIRVSDILVYPHHS
jgi:hypothetical protein